MAPLLRSAAALAALGGALARIHTLTITNDPRFVFSIESFGFLEGGKVALAVRSLAPQPAGAQHVLGFVMYPTDNQATVDANVRYLESSGICALDAAPEGALVMNVSEPALWPFFSTEGDITGGGEFEAGEGRPLAQLGQHLDFTKRRRGEREPGESVVGCGDRLCRALAGREGHG